MTRVVWYTARFEELRAAFGNRCVDGPAGCRGSLEFSHTRPTGCCGRGRGMPQRYHDIRANPECYALRCVKHHRAYDRAHWARLLAESEEAACRPAVSDEG